MRETRFKDTEIGRIPEDWEVRSISSLIDASGYGVGAEAIPYDGSHKYLRITDVDDISHRFVPAPLSSPSFFSKCHIAGSDDIFIARTGASVGKSYIYNSSDGCLVFAGFLIRIHVNGADSKLVFYHTLSDKYWKWIASESMRSGQPGINLVQLKQFQIPVPSDIVEQSRIASALTSIDNLISSLDKLIEKKKNIKQGTMQQLLTGKKRLKGFSDPWEGKVLGLIGETYSGLTGKTKRDFGSGNAKYITFLNVLNNPILKPHLFEDVNVKDSEHQNQARKGDLFFNTSSETPEEVGICAMLEEDFDKLYLNSFCFGYRPSDKSVYPKYMAYYFRSTEGRKLMTMLAQGVTRYNMSKSAFNSAKIFMPSSFDEQKAIADMLECMDREIESLRIKKAKYESIKQGMMQQLLTGKIRLVSQK